jgi:hypothetical protein
MAPPSPKGDLLVRLAAFIVVGGAVPSYGAPADAAVNARATATHKMARNIARAESNDAVPSAGSRSNEAASRITAGAVRPTMSQALARADSMSFTRLTEPGRVCGIESFASSN